MSEKFRRQVRWYAQPASGAPLAREEFDKLPRHGQAALWEVLARFKAGTSKDGDAKKEVDAKGGYPALWALRAQVGRDPFRLYYFQDSPVHYVIVMATYKNQQKLSKGDRDTSIRRLKAWRDAHDEDSFGSSRPVR